MLALLACLAAIATPAAAEETIERFASDITVGRDGTLTVAETIRVTAEGNQIRHGIYRDFPLTFEDADGTVHEVGFKLLNVTRDGQPEPHFTQSQGELIRIYAGDENVFLSPGTYTYVFTYETDRQIRWFDGKAGALSGTSPATPGRFRSKASVVRVTLPDRRGAGALDGLYRPLRRARHRLARRRQPTACLPSKRRAR